ncbi:MAG: RNA methyltransferase [Thiotrichales bacterium]
MIELPQPRFVLVETSHPGNIGAVARAMKTMCFSDLVLVKPQRYPSAEATARAAGADDVLARARVESSLEDALSGCTWVLGTSARPRSLNWPVFEPRAAAAQATVELARGTVALVFGRERNGLSNDELGLCHAMLNIPTNPDYSSLNLAAAVQLIAYELQLCLRGDSTRGTVNQDDILAGNDEMEGLFRHLEITLIQIGFLDPANPRQLMAKLRRLYNRARPTRSEVTILRGALTETCRRIGHKHASG